MISILLKYIRHKQKCSQKQLAEKVEISPSTISGYEKGQNKPLFEVVEKIANACDYDIVFVKRHGGETVTTENVARKDIPSLKE